jgi:hypothetical protein
MDLLDCSSTFAIQRSVAHSACPLAKVDDLHTSFEVYTTCKPYVGCRRGITVGRHFGLSRGNHEVRDAHGFLKDGVCTGAHNANLVGNNQKLEHEHEGCRIARRKHTSRVPPRLSVGDRLTGRVVPNEDGTVRDGWVAAIHFGKYGPRFSLEDAESMSRPDKSAPHRHSYRSLGPSVTRPVGVTRR